jgi:hypothetical protein
LADLHLSGLVFAGVDFMKTVSDRNFRF